MIKIFCDKCRADTKGIAYDLLIRVLHNPVPQSITDKSDPAITKDNISMRIILCQNCYKSLKFPNIHTSVRKNELIWRD